MTIIKNYGFLWERQYIDRGNGGAGGAGGLWGVFKDQEVNFRDQIGVYALYDSNQSIVYVGQAGSGNNATLFTRLKNHMSSGSLWNRWVYFSWVGFRDVNRGGKLSQKQSGSARIGGYTYGTALDEIEGVLIEFIEPKLNKQSGRLSKATEYFQVIKQDEPTLADLSNQIELLVRKMGDRA